MNEQVKDYIDKYPSEIIDMYNNLKKMIFDSVSCEPEETLWAKLPSYYVGELKIGIWGRKIIMEQDVNLNIQVLGTIWEKIFGYKKPWW